MMYVIIFSAILLCWLFAFDKPTLRIKFKDGKIESFKGHLPPSFKHNLVELGRNTPFSGELKAYRQKSGTRIKFSKTIPNKIQQRIRNVFPHQAIKSSGKKRSR
ncbi:hypothetical protein BCU68_00195 [Vibrio sp. 10N.286.49.B3]|uniref:DUF3634 family protein n=1 Tax=Vibrio sp. 10N.286.49.B3 TaxID=1880855 RepID=UPI000C85F017|nr:DUF3634 family protein [Vibrio sp. 10N.286.49.B3]PMH46875.1 hypothetical protein BCU68_00195 [Vibrio sp. 10N.286.49.B3]